MDEPKLPTPTDNIALNPNFRAHEGALLRALLQATDEGILLSGLDRQDLIANRRLGELFSMTPQDIVEAEPHEVGAQARKRVRDPEQFEALVAQTYEDPFRSYADEIELLTEPVRTLRRFTGPVCDSAGQPLGRLWTFLDISETKRLQAELEAQLNARTSDYNATSEVLTAMNDLCRLASHQQTFDELLVAMVQRVRPLLGQEACAILLLNPDGSELIGMAAPVRMGVRRLRMPCRRDPILAAVLQSQDLSRTLHVGLHIAYSGPIAGKLGCKSIGVAPLCSDNKIIGLLVLGTHDSEACLDHYRLAHLKALVDQIALTIQTHRWQADLNAALETLRNTQERMLEIEKLRTAGTLAASVAHDIRNILTAMQIEMDQEPAVTPDPVRTQINRFSALTHRLLAFARPGILESRPTSLNAIIERTVALIEGQAEVSAVEIVVDVPQSLPLLSADASQLDHLFVNLCLNAIQAMTRSGGTLIIRAEEHGHWIATAIQDTGCGIAPDHLERLFDPFFTTRATGFGLGLFSCKRIVEEHGGQITVESEPGVGSTFTVMFPQLVRTQ